MENATLGFRTFSWQNRVSHFQSLFLEFGPSLNILFCRRPCCHRYYFQIQNSKCVNYKNILQLQPNVNKITLKTFSLAFRADQKTLKERRSKMRHSVSPRESMEKEQQKTISSTNSNRSKKSASPIVMPPPPPPVWFIRNCAQQEPTED